MMSLIGIDDNCKFQILNVKGTTEYLAMLRKIIYALCFHYECFVHDNFYRENSRLLYTST